jgi:hypothetical protein
VSAAHESIADLAAVVQYLEGLSRELRAARRWRVPEFIAASDALACAAVLLRTQHDTLDGRLAHIDLLRDAVGLARSAVEGTKFAARERVGSHPPDIGGRI